MFWGPSVWAGLRAGDAGNAEEELGVKQNMSAVYPTMPSLFELGDTQRSWVCRGVSVVGFCDPSQCPTWT